MSSPPEPPSDQAIRDLLLRESLPPDEVEATWRALGQEDWRQADRALQRMAAEPHLRLALADVAPELLLAMRRSADPARALRNFERFAAATTNPVGLFGYLGEDPRTGAVLTTLFAGSQFLSDVLTRNPEYLELLTTERELSPSALGEDPRERLKRAAAAFTGVESRLDALRRFQRLELLRIGTADLLGLATLSNVVGGLSRLADALLDHCLRIAETALAEGDEASQCVLVCAFGKLGGRELNYSSDIDLLLLRPDNRPEPEAHRVCQRLVRCLTEATREGYLYRVDLRLRPYGSMGPLVPSLRGFLHYLQSRAALWEQQACLKLRPVSGRRDLAAALREPVDAVVYQSRETAESRASIRAMKARIESELICRREGDNVKLGVGGIRDIEFIVQCLQLENGCRHPEVRTGTTLDALARLESVGLLAEGDAETLRTAYIFLRVVEHRLQMMESRQVHTLPKDPVERRSLAIRSGLDDGPTPAEEQFDRAYARHTQAVRALFERLMGAP